MTGKGCTNKDKKTDGRMTPYDVRVRGTFAEVPRKKRDVRRPTSSEQKANNAASSVFAEAVFSVRRWKGVFLEELEGMNRGKVGRPFEFCDSEILWMMSLQALLSMTFREAAGIAAAVLGLIGMRAPSYSRLFERSCSLAGDMQSDPEDGIFVIRAVRSRSERIRRVGLDSSGFNLSDATMWRENRWGVGPERKGWLKLHALSDVDTGEIIAYAVTTETTGDSPMLIPLLDAAAAAGHRISVLYADGAYSSAANFRHVCEDMGSGFVTSFRCDTLIRSYGSPSRGEATRLWCSLPYSEWTEVTGYGRRWKCECVFSDIKRMLGETLNAHTVEGAVRKLMMKTSVFNRYKTVRRDIMEGERVPS